MNAPRTRREFLTAVGQGMLVAGVGAGLASDLGLSPAFADEGAEALSFGALDPLVALMQETSIERLLPTLVERINSGTELKTLLAAGALANARSFGGEDYIGYHTMMALSPAYQMSRELSGQRQALPILKVLYRNTNRIQEHGGRKTEVLHPVKPGQLSPGENGAEALQNAVRAADLDRSERTFAALAQGDAREAFDQLLYSVQDDTAVHRVVLPYRAWELLGLIGYEHAHTMLRQSVRFCVKERPRGEVVGQMLPKVLDQHKLAGRTPGDRAADDAWIDQMSQTLFNATPAQAADAAAAALAEGFSPDALREAISLAANQLVLRDIGRIAQHESPGKPIGSVHGDSVGVHACDSANAWCNMAKVGSPRNVFACLILGAYQVAQDRENGRGDFLHWDPLPIEQNWNRVTASEPQPLLKELDTAIRGNLQHRACRVVQQYGKLGHDPRPVFDLMLGYATSEDGSLHAEKYYRTASQEFAQTRPAFRWRQMIALARVTASEYGRPAPGSAEARELLKIT